MTTASQSIALIPLNHLVAWSGNVRKTGATDGLDELTASIAAHGLLQSLVVRKTSRGKFAVVAGKRRLMALSGLAEGGALAADAPVPCRIITRSADATEISLTENVVRVPMHPADQFEAFRDLIDGGSTPADIAARFGITEAAVKKRLKLARVSPAIFEAYRGGQLTLEQVQAFTVSDDHAAQECVLNQIGQWSDDADDIRRALTQDDIPATDKRARFVTVAAYEEAGGAVKRDLFAEGDDGVFLLDSALLDRLAHEKLEALAATVRGEGWKWVEIHPEFDYAARAQFKRRHPEPMPLNAEDAAEQSRLSQEYEAIYDALEEGDEAACARLDEIEARIAELEDRECAFSPETIAVAGAVVTLACNGEAETVRGLMRPQDAPCENSEPEACRPEKPDLSASLVQSLTEQKSAAIGAELAGRPHIALAAVVHALASDVFPSRAHGGSVQMSARITPLREDSKAKAFLEQAHARWCEKIPGGEAALWQWCLAQEQQTLLELLAFCAGRAVNAVRTKQDRPDAPRIAHADALAKALSLDMTEWFTPGSENFFLRVSRPVILAAIAEAKATPAKRSWEKLRKSELATLAEREIAGTGWLPQPIRA